MAGPVLFTGNNVDIWIQYPGQASKLFAFVEQLTISRSAGRQNQYAVGSPIRVDAPVTQATVSIQANNLVPITSNQTLQSSGANIVHNSLLDELNAEGSTISVHAKGSSSTVLASAVNCLFDSDSMGTNNTQPVTYNLSWSADDTTIFAANN